MEPEEIEPHPDFVKGFNEGYVLARDLPKLADKISKALNDTERSKGFLQGREQYVLEQVKEKGYPQWLTQPRKWERDNKDKGDLEPEKE